MKNKFTFVLFALSIIFVSACKTQKKQSTQEEPYPLIVVSIDGFRNDYLDKANTPNLDKLVKKGALAEYMTPIFPSKTFPTHYAMVTGLYPENSGLISNNMFDSIMRKRFTLRNREAVQDPRWYGGEPIWVTAEKQGLTAATLFWPGSEAPIKGTQATYWLEYNESISHNARVDTIVNWFKLHKKPNFATFYMSHVDTQGHRHGPNSDSVRIAIEEADRTIGLLIKELEAMNIWPNVNLIITSDHGMTEISDQRVILLDDIIDINQVHMNDWNPVAMIQPKNGNLETIYNQLKSQESKYTVYKKENLPERFRLKNHHRVPEIIMIADPGYTITTKNWLETRGVSGGNHGYDNLHPDMRAFFLAVGPNIKNNHQFNGFESVNLYEFMCYLLNIKPAPNDGSLETLKPILKAK